MHQTLATIVFFILAKDKELLNQLLPLIEKKFGKVEYISEWFEFNLTNYYKEEMGSPLYRCIISMEKMVEIFNTTNFKKITAKIENKFKVNSKRQINIDAGIVDYYKLVLFTGKFGGHKFPLKEDVWADLLMIHNKRWECMPWAFPDFKSGIYDLDLSKIRNLYKTKITKNK